MRHWNTQQSGGQGLAFDFNKYFKALSKEEKEVRGQLPAYTPQSMLTTPRSIRSLSREKCTLLKALQYVLIQSARLVVPNSSF
jgi:hypothetical protein